MAEPLVELAVEEPGWCARLPDLAALAEAAVRAALAEQGLDPAAWTVSLLATDDARMAALNRAFRGREGPTNVLSWPAHDLAPAAPGARPPPPPAAPGPGRAPLGDVALALQTVEREAAEAGIPLKDHAVHLILHGCLHLLGFDHEREADAAVMEGIERRLLASLGVPDPYA